MVHLSIDIETYSNVDLKKSGLYKYVQSPDFQILLIAYSFSNDGDVWGPVKIFDFITNPPDIKDPEFSMFLFYLFHTDCLKHAYNAAFEWYCLSKHFSYLVTPGFMTNWISQWRCTMVHGLYCGFPAGLSAVGEAVGLPQEKKKLGIGMSLIRTFCVLCKPSKTNGQRLRTMPHHEPEKWNLFKEYCKQDVYTEIAVAQKLKAFPLPDQEQQMWEVDMKINAFGVKLDNELIYGALACSDVINTELINEAIQISGIDNPKSVQKLTKWLEEETEEEIENLQKATVSKMIKTTDNNNVKRMLEIRQELSKTSVKKYTAMVNAMCDDGRVRGLLQFYGANRTGRWAGRLVQVQNLPRNYLDTLDLARDFVRVGKTDMLKLVYGNVPDTLSQLIRTAFIPSDGNTLLVADFSAIEARVIAWLAGEEWRQEVFRTHGKIYEASASAMFNVPLDLIKKGNPEYELRQKGKVAELALGYQGGSGALISMGALNMGLTEDELPDIVSRWRNANKRIVALWYAVGEAVKQTISTGKQTGVRGVLFSVAGNDNLYFLTIQLPSGRKLYYAYPSFGINQFGSQSITYWGVDQTKKKWKQLDTYGGKLVENIVQAIARDCLAEAIKRLANTGYQIVMHIHDEVVIDCRTNNPKEELDKACRIMGEEIRWAPGLLLRADGFTTNYYMKE